VPLLLRPKWLAWHAFALVATYVMLRLGLWQWQRAHATHSAQNMGYALQWPAFALFGLAVWFRVCRDAVRPPEDDPPAERSRRRPAPEPAAAVAPVTDEEDPELAAYNRYLARLNEDAGGAQRDRARPGRPAAGRGAP
jgi:DNA-binding transcriptional regulator of glucitol operon